MASSGAASGASNGLVCRRFPWTTSTPGLFTPNTGWSFYTGKTGDLLHDVWIELDTIGGSTAYMDVGTYTAGETSGFFQIFGNTVSMAVNVGSSAFPVGYLNPFNGVAGYAHTGSGLPPDLIQTTAQFSATISSFDFGSPPLVWTANQPLKAIITATGAFNGAAVTTPGSMKGVIYLVTSTPA